MFLDNKGFCSLFIEQQQKTEWERDGDFLQKSPTLLQEVTLLTAADSEEHLKPDTDVIIL